VIEAHGCAPKYLAHS